LFYAALSETHAYTFVDIFLVRFDRNTLFNI